jgi:DNA-binding transcriptional LysR family regulator
LFSYWQDQVPGEERWHFGGHQYMGAIAPIRQWVLAGRGVAVLPEYFAAPELAAGRLVQVLDHVESRTDWFRLVWLEGHMRSAELEEFGQFLRGRPLA